jgi:hypothetical protein
VIHGELRRVRSDVQAAIGRRRGFSAEQKRDMQAYAKVMFVQLREALERDIRAGKAARKAALRAAKPGATGRPTKTVDGQRRAKSSEGVTGATRHTLRTSVGEAAPEAGTRGAPLRKPRRVKHQTGAGDEM